jgi:preprotein translocase subunit YajC
VLIDLLSSSFLLGQQEQNPGGLLFTLMPLVLVFVLYMVLIQRPQKRQQQLRQEMLKAIKKNDRIVTIGGIYGVVTNIQADANEITVRVDEGTNTKLRMTLSSIERVIGEETPSDKEAK